MHVLGYPVGYNRGLLITIIISCQACVCTIPVVISETGCNYRPSAELGTEKNCYERVDASYKACMSTTMIIQLMSIPPDLVAKNKNNL